MAPWDPQHKRVRTSRVVRGVLAAVLALMALTIGASRAEAQDGGTTTNATFALSDFFVAFYGSKTDSAALGDRATQQFFNQANCLCKTPVRLVVKFTSSGSAKAATLPATTPVTVTLGEMCNAQGTLLGTEACVQSHQLNLADFRKDGMVIDDWTAETFSIRYGYTDTTSPDAGAGTEVSTCHRDFFNQTLWVLMNTDNAGGFDQVVTRPVPIDLQPPPTPAGFKLTEGNEAVNTSWDALDSTSLKDIKGYQVLCSRDDHDQVFAKGTFGAAFTSAAGLRLAGNTGCPDSDPSPLVARDPLFACSGLLPTAASSYRVAILQNQIWYGAMVVAIDNANNPSAVKLEDIQYRKPVPSNDFFHYYKGNGESGPDEGQAQGGFCRVVPVSGKSLAGGACVLGVLSLIAVRRRRRRP